MNDHSMSVPKYKDSIFDGQSYQFIEQEGVFAATLVHKRWGEHANMLVYFNFDDGRKIVASVWWTSKYLGMNNIPVGTQMRLYFQNSKKGVPYLREVEPLNT